ncbi:hypothetical protein F7725_003445 [Dissostichus mawsoni]|uniref:Uncharacterized protein n=1 Tax=Dissostichus mawsoni TaxID=36200 RepID=A0A7J5YCV8_DISMA|nr:hypothetical protein F7725_003445 [Dissostichus mawsoni]
MFLFYVGAKEIRGEGSLKNMRETIEKHIRRSKDVMFVQAKDAMMKQLRDLKVYVSVELEMVKKYYNELTGSPDDDAILW